MNPFPPFSKKNKDSTDNVDYYKNAVSGDYDLFAIWPNMDISLDELTRQSDMLLAKTCGLAARFLLHGQAAAKLIWELNVCQALKN